MAQLLTARTVTRNFLAQPGREPTQSEPDTRCEPIQRRSRLEFDMKQAVYGIVNTAPQANAVVERLVASGFLSSDISVLLSPLLENAAQDNSHRLSAVVYSIFSQTRQKRSRSLDVIGRSLQLARSMGCACRSPSWKIFSNCSPVLLPMTTASTSSLKSTLR